MTMLRMCKRSKAYNIVFADGVMQEVIDLINSKSKDLFFERRDIVTSHNHSLFTKLLAKIGEFKLLNYLSCGVHYRIYEQDKEILCAKVLYSEGEFGNTEFTVDYRGMPALQYKLYCWNIDSEAISDTIAVFDELRKNNRKFKNFVGVFDFNGYINTPSFLRPRGTLPIPFFRGHDRWARVGVRRAMKQVKLLQKQAADIDCER